MSRIRLDLKSELGQLQKDINKLSDEDMPKAFARGVGSTLECARDDLQTGLNKSIEGGPDSTFLKDFAVGWNVGKRGRVSTGKRTQLPTAKDFTSTMSGRVFIQEQQEKILDNALSNATVSKLEYTSGKTLEPFTIPRNVKSLYLSGDKDSKALVLKKNNKGNVIRFRRGALGKLKDAAREQVKGNRPPRKGKGPYSRTGKTPDGAKYFEVKNNKTGRSGKKLYPGIYRREDNKKAGEKRNSRVFQVVTYQNNLTYSKLGKKFDFDKTAVSSIESNFANKMDKAIQAELRKTLG